MEGKKIQIGRDRFRVIKEYFAQTYNQTYLLLEDAKKELYICKMDQKGNISEVTTEAEMDMLEIVFGEEE